VLPLLEEGSMKRHFPVRRLGDGRALVNLGSSAQIAPGWNNVDFSWLVRIARYRRLCSLFHRLRLLNDARYARILRLDAGVVCWDLRRGVPFPDQTFDAAYHSHVLEHLDREDAPGFLQECLRILKPGGILRIVVPDFEALARDYLEVVEKLPGRARMAEHTFAVEQMIDQMVLRTPRHRSLERPLVRFMESFVVGNTDRAGILHRWMYDRFSAGQLLTDTGFEDIQVRGPVTSGIAGWREFHLDTESSGEVHLPSSLYIEGRRPSGSSGLRRPEPGPS
jgi:SAM-dependent methyltransferase